MKRMCAEAGLTKGQLRLLLDACGLQPLPAGARRKLPAASVLVEMIEQGQHPDVIGERYGVTASAVHGALRRAGVTARQIRLGLHKKMSRFGIPSVSIARPAGQIVGGQPR